MENIYYHVVTNTPMKVGQIIIFDDNHHSGVYERVYSLEDKVKDIYANPDKYKDKKLDHHLKVALRELAMEEVRKKEFSEYPSRLKSLYVSKTYNEAYDWFNYFIKLGRKTCQIVKIRACGNSFTANACNCFDGTINQKENIRLARIYWEGKNNIKENSPVYETIVDGEIEVLEIIKEKD